jgi:membrane protein implicated in regulation of membrane protease activity
MSEFAPVIVIELFLVFGGVVLFAWWQFRDLRKERKKRERHQRDQTSGKQ